MTAAAQKTPVDALARQPTASGTIAGDGVPLPIIYGTDRVEASILSATVDNDTLILVCIWGIGPIDAILGVTINNRPAPAGVVMRHYLGTAQQQPDPKLQSVVSGYADRGVSGVSGETVAVAYSVIEIPSDAVSGWPRIAATIRGRKVFDPRSGQTIWTDNPALCLADLISSKTFGQGRPVTGVEDAANYCDELVGGEHRRTVGLTIRNQDSTARWVETLRTYAGCFVVNEGDTAKLVPDRPVTSPLQLTGDDYLADSLRASYPDIRERPTVVRVEYTDTSSIPWRSGYAIAKADGVDSGAVIWREERVSLPGIHSSKQAMREAKERLAAAQLGGILVEWTALDDGLLLQQGDVVELAIAGQPRQLRVMAVDDNVPGRYTVEARGYDPSIYSDDTTGVQLMPPPPQIIADDISAPNVTGVTSGGGVYVPGGDGTVFNRIRIDLEPPSFPNFDHYEVRFRPAGSSDPWDAGVVVGSVAFLQPVEDGVEYEFEVRSVGKMGAVSAWTPGTHTVRGKDVPPPAPGNLDVTVSPAGVRKISWDYPNPPRDLAGFRIQWDAGQGWTDLLDGLTQRRMVETNEMPAGNVNIRVRAEDRTGNTSGWKYHSSNIAQGPDGVWYDVDQRIEAERIRNDGQDGTLTSHDGRIVVERNRNDWQDGSLTDHDGRIIVEKNRNDGQDGSLTDHDGRIVVEKNRNDWQDGNLSDHDGRISVEKNRNDNQDGSLGDHDSRITVERNRNDNQDGSLGDHDNRITVERNRNDGQDGTLGSHDNRISVERNRNDGQDGTLSAHGNDISVERSRNDTQDGTLSNHGDTLSFQGWKLTELEGQVGNAQNTANNAYQQAIEALNTAGLKGRVFYQGYAPGDATENDLWINTSENFHPYVMKGGGWQDASVLQANVIQATHIVASAIVAEHLAAGAVTAEKIAANSILAQHLAVNSLDAITANLGTITAGILRSSTGASEMNLVGGNFLTAGSGKFVVGHNGVVYAQDLYVWGTWPVICGKACRTTFTGYKKVDEALNEIA